MALKVLWTNSAIQNLEGIFDYYKSKANIIVARDIINKIVNSSILIQFQPKMGQVKELLKGRLNEYRFVIEGNYKIIYWIEETNIKIASDLIADRIRKKFRKYNLNVRVCRVRGVY